jgi:hypothetical protein
MDLSSEGYKDALFVKEFLPELRKAVEGGVMNFGTQTVVKLVNMINNMALDAPLQTAVALNAWKLLAPFIRGAVNYHKAKKNEKESHWPTLRFIIQRLYINSSTCFLSQEKELSDLFGSGFIKELVQ